MDATRIFPADQLRIPLVRIRMLIDKYEKVVINVRIPLTKAFSHNSNFPCIPLQESDENFLGSTFPGSAGTQKPEDLPFPDLEIQIPGCRFMTARVLKTEIICLYHRLCFSGIHEWIFDMFYL